MATIREELKLREEEAYDAGWKAGRKKSTKRRTTTTLLWILTGLFVFVVGYCLGVWIFKGYYPESIMNLVGAGYFTFIGAATAKSGFENYGRITHAEEYNNNYPDA